MILDWQKTNQLLEKYQVPLVESLVIKTAQEGIMFSQKNGWPVVLKVISLDVLHKIDQGLVKLNIQNKQQLQTAFTEILEGQTFQEWKGRPSNRFSNGQSSQVGQVVIQKQVEGVEIFVGLKRDKTFGLVLSVGMGGIFVEVLNDVVFGLWPLDKKEILEMIGQLKGYKILNGYRGGWSVNINKLADIILKIAQMAKENPQIEEIDFNPIMAKGDEILIVDPKIIWGSSVSNSNSKNTPIPSDIFEPKTVALIGATSRKGSVGLGIAKNLWQGKKHRKVFFVNPNSQNVLGQKTFSSVLDIKEKIDLAIVAVPSKIVHQVCLECCQARVGAIIIISSGFAETGKQGQETQKEIALLLQKNNIPLIGPNCLGVINPNVKFNGSFAPETPKPGHIAFFSQSGALIDSVIDQAILEKFGFSLLVSYGNEAGLSLSDFLQLAKDHQATKVIAVYLEEIKNGEEFINIAKQVAKEKPIVVLRGGKTEPGQKAVLSHTASLAGNNKIYEAAFKRVNVLEVATIEELFLVSRALTIFPKTKNSWAVLTNGGAVGVIIADWCSRFNVNLASINKNVFEELASSEKINKAFSRHNPLDIVGDASSDGYKAALLSLLKQPEINGVIFCQTLQTMTNPKENAKIILEAQKQFPQKPILPLFLGGKKTKKGSDLLFKKGGFCFSEPRDVAVVARALSSWTGSDPVQIWTGSDPVQISGIS